MLQHLFSSYMDIDKIDLKENTIYMVGLYNPVENLSHLIDQTK